MTAMIEFPRDTGVGVERAGQLLGKHYAIEGKLTALTAERDCNFRVELPKPDEPGLVFKVFAPETRESEADLLARVLLHVDAENSSLPLPRLRLTAATENFFSFVDENGRHRYAIAYSFRPGIPLFSVPREPEQAAQCGALLAKLAIALRGFSHPGMHRDLIWDLRQLPRLRPIIRQIAELPFAAFVDEFLDMFERDIAAPLEAVPCQFVHNDFNARNIIVAPERPSQVTGIIDFGDALHTARIADVAVGVIGQITDMRTAPSAMATFVDAYRTINPLTSEEMRLLPALVAARIVQNIVMTCWYRTSQPTNVHFSAFEPAYFEERVEFAKKLLSA